MIPSLATLLIQLLKGSAVVFFITLSDLTDKINQLRHVRFFGDTDGVRAHMQRHRAILEPKFEAVGKELAGTLGALGVGEWSDPDGGYFVNLDVVPGTASRVVELAGRVGVSLTPAGATFPAGEDPEDANIRIASHSTHGTPHAIEQESVVAVVPPPLPKSANKPLSRSNTYESIPAAKEPPIPASSAERSSAAGKKASAKAQDWYAHATPCVW